MNHDCRLLPTTMFVVRVTVLIFVLASLHVSVKHRAAVAATFVIRISSRQHQRYHGWAIWNDQEQLATPRLLHPHPYVRPSILLGSIKDEDKFGIRQRFASIQCLLLGAIVGSIAQAPASLLHDTLFNGDVGGGLAQWEYDTDMAAVAGGLFAVVYRYCIREDTTNPQLNQGIVSAMILTRTLPQVQIPTYCQAIPLNCDRPPLSFYIFDWNIIQQLLWCGLESTLLFVGTAAAMDMAMEKGYIIRFPG